MSTTAIKFTKPNAQLYAIDQIKTTYTMPDGRVENRVREDMGNLDEFWEDIVLNGLIEPIVVNSDGVLVEGGRRVAAFSKFGQTHIPAIVAKDYDDLSRLILAEAASTSQRKDFTVAEKLKVIARTKPILEEANRKKMADGAKKGGKKKTKPVGGEAPAEGGEPNPEANGNGKPEENGKKDETGHTRDVLAKMVGWSPETLRKALEIEEAAAKNKKYAKYLEKMCDEGKVGGAYVELKQAQKPKAKSAAEGPIKDASGEEVPTKGGVADRFADVVLPETVEHMDEVLSSIRQFQSQLKNYSNGNPWLRWQREKGEEMASVEEALAVALKSMKAAQDQVKSAVPHVVCPHCKGEKCHLCYKSGFYPEWKANEDKGIVK